MREAEAKREQLREVHMKKYESQLPIRVSIETRKKLDARAKREGRTTSAMARLIVERALRKEEVK
jgi:predicted DNA-binding protein